MDSDGAYVKHGQRRRTPRTEQTLQVTKIKLRRIPAAEPFEFQEPLIFKTGNLVPDPQKFDTPTPTNHVTLKAVSPTADMFFP